MIYLDNAATTKPYNECLKQANIVNTEEYFNPSALYQKGIDATKIIKTAKNNILRRLGAINHEVIFTSCGSESDNQAVFCAVNRGVFVTDKGEHSAIHKSFLELKNRGRQIEFIDLNKDGSVNTDKLFDFCLNNEVSFVSIIHVNNETGAINDVNYIAEKIKSINKNIVFHVDGVQAYGKLDYKISDNVDLYSISAHKINALKGTGVLIKKKNLHLNPLIFGGGQENGLRSGTENVFGIKVFDLASEIHYGKLKENYEHVSELKRLLIEKLDKELFYIISTDNGSPYILSVSAVCVRGEVVMHTLENFGIIVGNGSACSSKNRYSRIIEACGYDKKILDGVIRISFSAENTVEEIEFTADKLNSVVKRLKGIMK